MTPEEELLDELRRDYSSADIQVIASSDRYFRRLEDRYPVCGSKIDWDRVPASRIHRLEARGPQEYFEQRERFFDEVRAAEHLDLTQQLVVIGDGGMECALEMSIATLRSCLRTIVAMPTHIYVLSPDASWCMVFTMEGDGCFGHAPH